MIKQNEWFLIGSWALKSYGLLIDREPSDLDFLSTQPKSTKKIKGIQVEHSYNEDHLEKTNKILWDYCLKNKEKSIVTPLGEFWVAPLEVLKVLKISSLPLNKAKNVWDLKQLSQVTLSKDFIKLAEERTEETLKKVEKQLFFNKYPIVRYMEHDVIHRFVAKVPAYTKILDSSVHISLEKFNALSFEEKYLELFEESFVLAMERELIPAYKKYPFLLKNYYNEFALSNKSSSPARKWMFKLITPGLVKDRPDWIAQWGSDNYETFHPLFDLWWNKTLENLSEDFWVHFLSIRDLQPLK